jgi:hypothetical protein
VVVYDVGNWLVDRYAINADYARVTARSIARNLRGGWWHDDDDFNTNQVLHPYQGASAALAGRSAGLGFWSSGGLAVGGSLLWKIAGESGPPSWNDMIMNSVGGTVFGEALFRLSRLVLDRPPRPGAARRLGAFVIAPAAAPNDLLLEGHICNPDPPVPPYRARFSMGAGEGSADAREGHLGIPFQGRLGFDIEYGLPDELEPHLPFDHFRMSFTYLSATAAPWNQLQSVSNPVWYLSVDGLVAGGSLSLGEGDRLLYGLFGTFDYGGPVLLRVSATGLGPGVVIASDPSERTSVEATLLASAVFGSGGGRAPIVYERDYQNGFGVMLVARGRLGLGKRFALEAGARGYVFPSSLGRGSEGLLVATGSAVLRVFGSHSLALDAMASRRSVRFTDSRYGETARILGVSYSYVLDRR